MVDPAPLAQQRPQRTRAAILRAFVGLVLDRRYDTIRIADLVAASGVARATFYDHFRGKNDVLLAALEPVLLALTMAATGRESPAYLKQMVSHLWERRASARVILNATNAPVVQRRLAAMIHAKMAAIPGAPNVPAVRTTAAAAAQIALLRCWLNGEHSCSVDDITDEIINCARLII